MADPQDDGDDDMDYLFKRVTVDNLARAIIGDVRIVPTEAQLAHAQAIIDKTGTLYRMVAGFHLRDWAHKAEG